MNIQDALLTSTKARPKTKRSKTTKVAIHWVGNAGSSAMANRNYFNNSGLSVSSHYIIGLDGEVIKCVPEDEIAYATNTANSYAISIENCHPDWTGKFNSKTYASLVELCADLCKRYNLNPTTDLIRHYDVTKKCCPKYFVDHSDEWNKFKNDVKEKLTVRGWVKDEKGEYYYILESEEKANNWLQLEGNWYYFKDNIMVTGWLNLDGKFYYFDDSGVMKTSWIKDKDGREYFLDESGVMVTGFQFLGGTWWYFQDNGALLKNAKIKISEDGRVKLE